METAMLRTLAAAAILALTVTAAQAETPEQVSVDVSYGDLNLTHTADAKILANRLQAAAQSVCKPVSADSQMQDCMRAAIRGAIASIESKMENNLQYSLGGS